MKPFLIVGAVNAVMLFQLEFASAKGGFSWNVQNCSAELHVPLKTGVTHDSDTLSYSPDGQLNTHRCPPWFRYNPLNGTCSFTHSINGRVSYVHNTLQTAVLQCYCMTNDSNTHQLALSACPYTCLVDAGYYTLPCVASTVQNFTCGQFKREGLSCGECAPGHAAPVYSYSSHCVNCSHVNFARNLVKYLTIAYLPLTLFTISVIVFRINANSPYLFGYVFIAQTITMSTNMRLLQTLLNTGRIHSASLTKWGISMLSFWNLDFFRVHYTPFCLHPGMTTLVANFMDFLVAVYPIILIVILGLLVELGVGRTRLCQLICTPINRLRYKYGIEWDMRSNLVSALATFILLSNEKILSASFDMLLPAYIYPIEPHASKELHVFSSGSVRYFSSQHAPFAVSAILFLIMLVILPMLLLLLYPFSFFHRCLRKLGPDSGVVNSLVHHFCESYKSKREDGVEYRWFPLAYFILRIILCLLYGAALSSFYFPLAGVILTAFIVFLAVCRPRKSDVHNAIDMYHIMCFLIFILGIMANITANSQTKRKEFLHTSVLIISIASCLPMLYLMGLIAYSVFRRMGLGHKIRRCLRLHKPFWPGKGYERIANDYRSFEQLFGHCNHQDYGSVSVANAVDEYTLTDSAIN